MSNTSKQMQAIMERIKNKRESLGLSYQQLADLTQLSKSTLQRYETGGIKNIPLDKLEVLAKALQTTPEWILGWNRDMDELDKIVYKMYPDFVPGENYISDCHLAVTAVSDMEQQIKEMVSDTAIPWDSPTIKTKKVPLLGTIACGKPILAEENIEDFVSVPADIDSTFALRCKGDSMINARILNGDIVYIREQPEVENGEIAAVLIDNEATLKRVYYYPEKSMLILKPENPTYQDFIYINEELNNIKILGKAVAFLSVVK